MPPTPSLTLILAATPSLGIGKAGGLPWPQLRKEMGYFARVTKRVAGGSSSSGVGQARRVNAVLMGRKTWDSIPPAFRPLKGRLNVVVTRDVEGFRGRLNTGESGEKDGLGEGADVEGPLVCGSVAVALARLAKPLSSTGRQADASVEENTEVQVESIFVIGGASIYNAALELPQTKCVLLTKIQEEYECDTFFGVDLDAIEGWEKATEERWKEVTGESVAQVEEKGVKFEFGMYERQ